MSKAQTLKYFYRLFLLFWCSPFNCSNLYAQDPDSVVTVKNTQFLRSALAKPDLETSITSSQFFLSSYFRSPILALKDLCIIKNKKGVFLCVVGTSRVYRMHHYNDTALVFRRNDNFIENINYNISAYFFTYAGSIYNYAGYGFWKTNGFLRKYNEMSREWDIVPLSREVHNLFDIHHAWINMQSSKMFILYEHMLNEGINDKEKNIRIIPTSYLLDLKTNHVSELGQLSPILLEAIQKAKRLIHTPEGIILLRSPFAYYLKPAENTYYSLNDNAFIQALERSDRNGMYYYHDGKVYFTGIDHNKFDSVYVNRVSLKKEGKIWSRPIQWYIILPVVSALFIAGMAVVYRRVNKRNKKVRVPTSNGNTTMIAVPLLTETEASLLQMLINKTLEGGFASSNDINYIIGCKDKNVGLQKKMRSDMINGINSKFKAYSKNELPLIESQRTDADKRYFQYAIHPECLDQAQQFVEMTRSLET